MRIRLTSALVLGAALILPSRARATSVLEVSDNGSEQMGRGGAWVARASDPLATFYNPAGLAGQRTTLTLQSNFLLQDTCFTRVRAANDMSAPDPLVDPATGRYPKACSDTDFNLSPQLGATWRVSQRVGLGVLFVAPSGAGNRTWPEYVDGPNGPEAAPNRYLFVRQRGFIAYPSIGVGVEAVEGVRLGASVHWGMAHLNLANASVALNGDGGTATNDVRTQLQARDMFIPGFTAGALWSATPFLDVGAWYRFTDAIRARGDLGTAANFYSKQAASGDMSKVRYGDTIFEDCGTGTPVTACGGGGNATVKLVVPMEAKIGVRYHKPRGAAGRERDPLKNDVFDVEANLTWANNSAADTIQIRFPGDASGGGVLPVSGIPGGVIPPNADQPRGYRDVWGVRVGGDYAILPDRLAARAGGFFESAAQDDRYQALDFAGSQRFGLALGGTYRIAIGDEGRKGSVDLMVAYGHVFFAKQRNDDPNAPGLPALAGTECNPASDAPGDRCPNGVQKYRTNWPVNLGEITNALNVINVGAAYRF